jgi:dihydrofolate synthase/folylpolyglutamate synthase
VRYQESLEWLDSTRLFGIKLGLANTRLLLEALDNPQDHLAIFHVAGTNGKGSVCAMLDAILRAGGYRTGLYTSPHLMDFRERIRVDGRKIFPGDIAQGLTRLRAACADWDRQPTFFELTTVLALWHFAHSECTHVVLETGLGGRLDATNAVAPAVCAITPIGLDHRQWLGNTVAEIAAEKAGIIKPGVPVVSARQDPEAAAVLEEQAARLRAPLTFVTEPLTAFPVALPGVYQQYNAALALAAIEKAGVPVPPAAVEKALAEVRWPGRFQIVHPRLVLDGAHNPPAAENLVQIWRERFGEEKPVIIFGALSDKDFPVIIERLEAIAAEFYFVPVRNSRAADPAALAASCQVPHQVFASLESALAASRGLTLVTGSLFLVGEAMGILGLEA